MADSEELRAKARRLYDLAQRVDGWRECVELRFQGLMLEIQAEELEEAEEHPYAHIIASAIDGESA